MDLSFYGWVVGRLMWDRLYEVRVKLFTCTVFISITPISIYQISG